MSQVLREGDECQVTQRSSHGSLGKHLGGSGVQNQVKVALGFGSEISPVGLGFARFLHIG